jgi:hypothetical protein
MNYHLAVCIFALFLTQRIYVKVVLGIIYNGLLMRHFQDATSQPYIIIYLCSNLKRDNTFNLE